MTKFCLIPAHERYGLSREASAEYLSIGVTLFDDMVGDGRMPSPRELNKRRVWSRVELERAFNQLPRVAWGDPAAPQDDQANDDTFWNRVA